MDSYFRNLFGQASRVLKNLALDYLNELVNIILMTTDELQKLDKDLEQEERNLTDQLNRIASQNKGDFTVRVPNYGDEDDENTQEIVDLDRNFAMVQELESKLNSIKKTRQKIKEGSYGKCENCGISIAPERLKVMPEATKCITCAI